VQKKSSILDTKSSSSRFTNGGLIRRQSIERVLRFEGYKVEIYKPRNDYAEASWDLIVVLGPKNIGQAFKLAATNTKVWIDFCDSWVYQRFSWTTGPRLFFVGLVEIIFILWNRNRFKSILVTYISNVDLIMDKFLHRFIGVNRPLVLENCWETPQFEISKKSEKRLVFIGDGGYFPNVLAALELSLLIAPRISKVKEMRTVHIYGYGWPRWISNFPNLRFHGYQDAKLLYLSGDIHLAPLRQRSGVKNKIVMPLTLGLPVIAYKRSLNGVPKSPSLFSADSISEFVALASQPGFPKPSGRLDIASKADQNIHDWLHID
jgi:hypothetical protein